MFELLGSIFSNIISTMNNITIYGDFTLLHFSIGSSVLALAIAAYHGIFGSSSGGDK